MMCLIILSIVGIDFNMVGLLLALSGCSSLLLEGHISIRIVWYVGKQFSAVVAYSRDPSKHKIAHDITVPLLAKPAYLVVMPIHHH
jgi:hypothetical protein